MSHCEIDSKYPVEQHLVLEKCSQYETWVLRDHGYTINMKYLTNDEPKFDRHVRSDEFEDWFDRIIWYAKRQYKTASERMKIDEITALCLFGGGEKFQTILCGQQDDCLCENLPPLAWLGVLSEITDHLHLEPICICDSPTAETKQRVLKSSQSSNVA
jgi:hypothetical protein